MEEAIKAIKTRTAEVLEEFTEIGKASAQTDIARAMARARENQLKAKLALVEDRVSEALAEIEKQKEALAAHGELPATTLAKNNFSPDIAPIDEVLSYYGENPGADSPLDQFEIFPLLPMKMGDFFFSFTNSSLFMLLTLGLVLLMILLVTKKGGGKLVPNAWQSVVELIYDFVLNLVNEQIGGPSANVKQKFFPCILVTFTFLLFCNLQGMIPFSFTVTSHFLITLALSFSLFIGITIVGFQRHGLHFFSFLLPAGVPLPLAPFLVLLELISHCFRALSSGIRLFANMMAGHSLVKILSGFAWTMLFMNNIFYFIGDLGPLFIVLALTGLELGVAILQAYVFTILICIYLNDAINLH
jgi:F-type H+-transporting ATPase subunit a